MSNDTLLTVCIGAIFSVITAITIFGALREGKESFKKLNEHLDEKEKRQKEENAYHHEAQYH